MFFFAANLFLLFSSTLGSKMAGPHTQFVQSFIEECVECLEQGSRGSILQFMPFTMVSYEPGGTAVPVTPGFTGKALEFLLKCRFEKMQRQNQKVINQ